MKRLAGLFLLLLLISCERAIDPKLETQSPKLVVDGQIEDGQPPVIVLTRSIGYFSSIDSTQLKNTFVRGAVVTVSDGIKTHQLKEYAVPVSNGTVYYYSNDPLQPGTAIIGQVGKSYSLNIQADGKIYSSSTTIPAPAKKIDSLWWKQSPRKEYPDEVVLWGRFTDPPGYGNYIRYFTRLNNRTFLPDRKNNVFLPGWYSVYDDQFVDGKSYDLQVDAGQDKNLPGDNPSNSPYVFKGDTITMKFCNIDKTTFDFWRTWEYSYSAIGNPFGTPAKIQGNVSNGALGAFSGYSVQYKTVIIPK
jgi:hypothetical protein